MNLINPASSPFLLSTQTQGLHSSHSAFQKHRPSQGSLHSSKTISSSIPISLFQKSNAFDKKSRLFQDSDIVTYEPVKKVKVNHEKSIPVNSVTTYHTTNQQVKPIKLTIENVFNESKGNRKDGLQDDDCNEDLSLSFISSYPSLNSLEEENNETEKKEENQFVTIVNSEEGDQEQPLFVRDEIISSFSQLNNRNFIAHPLLVQPMPLQYSSYDISQASIPLEWQQAGILSTHHNLMQFPAMNLSLYRPEQVLLSYSQEDRADVFTQVANTNTIRNASYQECSEKRVKLNPYDGDGYNSDSHATRSTALEQENTDKSQAASPFYVEEKTTINSLFNPQAKKQRKQKKERQIRPKELKEKKGRSLNLAIDINPKHLKIERRLNRLQLLRYQQETGETEDEILKRLNAPVNIIETEVNMFEGHQNVQVYCPEKSQASIPMLNMEPPRRKAPLVSRWIPETNENTELDLFFEELGLAMDSPVTDQEKAIELLRSYNMDYLATIKAVRENPALFKELFRIKLKKTRRGANI